MAKDQNIATAGPRRGPPVAAAAPAPAAAKRPFNPLRFLREVQAEGRRVTWTSWKETWITSVMVGIMVVLTALFFYAIDGVLHLAMSGLFRLAGVESGQ